MGALLNYPHPRQLVFRKKDSGYLAVFMGVSAGFDLKTQRRFNGILRRFTIWSILLELGAFLGLALLSVRPLGYN